METGHPSTRVVETELYSIGVFLAELCQFDLSVMSIIRVQMHQLIMIDTSNRLRIKLHDLHFYNSVLQCS